MNQIFKVILMLILIQSAHAQTSRIFTLSADEWAQPRSGQVIAAFDSLRHAVEYWDKTYQAVVLIRYPGEDSGELWAAELKDWLISLGIPNDYIIMRAGLEKLDEVELVVGIKSEINL